LKPTRKVRQRLNDKASPQERLSPADDLLAHEAAALEHPPALLSPIEVGGSVSAGEEEDLVEDLGRKTVEHSRRRL
jgi:hypothetical protein